MTNKEYESEYNRQITIIGRDSELKEWLEESFKAWEEDNTPIKERYEQIGEMYEREAYQEQLEEHEREIK